VTADLSPAMELTRVMLHLTQIELLGLQVLQDRLGITNRSTAVGLLVERALDSGDMTPFRFGELTRHRAQLTVQRGTARSFNNQRGAARR